ncbi:MAG: hypothetical protein IKA49_04900 [Alistipes sp.]|nr:hypothetical protein [Alistipes sp.]
MRNLKQIAATLLAVVSVYSMSAQVVVDANEVVGKIKVMNAVNNAPWDSGETATRGNFQTYKNAEFSYARLHDAPVSWSWAHTVDVTCVFPDFSANENDPKSYDFTLTDKLIKTVYASGTKVFYRLGQSIEHWSKKYGVNPPADFKKWARICEHIIRHYNEGWADGFHYDIEYWEIWNEADIRTEKKNYNRAKSPTWTGTEEEFFRFYEIAAKHLKKCFPHLKVGGPALADNLAWADRFLAHLSKHKVGLDFFSYHLYFSKPESAVTLTNNVKALLDKHGYSDAEMILNEWNYIANWGDKRLYSYETISSFKGAAFAAAVMQQLQDSPASMLMYYDARPGTAFNGLFDSCNGKPHPQYYALYSWTKLRRLGTQVKTSVGDLKDLYATAAKSDDGRLMLLLTRYSDDDNEVGAKVIEIELKGMEIKEAISHVTDKYKLHTEVPVEVVGSKAKIVMEANSYTLIELR